MHPGPRDPSVLHLQSSHRSTEVWRVGGGDAQRCRRRNPNHTRFPDLHHRMLPLLQAAGFYGIARVSSLQLDWGLITALVERWRPETHTFHLPIGECTITLQDVGVLLGLPINGDPVISVIHPPGMSWPETVASVFGHTPDKTWLNGARLRLSWFDNIVPKRLDDNASDEELRHYTRCYLVQLIAGSMFTDHSGGLVHCMWLPYLQDIDACGKYVWGAAVLSFLYRELCKGCKMDREEVAGCLILLQLWAWERFPTLVPSRTENSLVDEQFWAGQLPGPHGLRWLVHHSFTEKNGRTVAVYRVILDELGSSHFIWQPYPIDVIDALPAYCLTGRHIWRYQGPLICVFIVEPHMVDRVFRQFGMLQTIPSNAEYSSDLHRLTLQGNVDVNWLERHQASINIWNSRLDYISESEIIVGDSVVPEYHDWYIERTRRFHSRMGALHAYIGDLLKNIADRTQSVLPDVGALAIQGWHYIQDRSHYGLFETLPLDERREKEREGRQIVGRRPKRGGHRGGRGGAHSGRPRGDDVFVDQVVPAQGEGEDNHDAAHLGDDDDLMLHEGDLGPEQHFNVGEVEADVEDDGQQTRVNSEVLEADGQQTYVNSEVDEADGHRTHSDEGGSVHHVLQPNQDIHEGMREPILSHPTFNLGLTPGGSLLPSQEPIQQEPILTHPTFDLGISPIGYGRRGSQSQSSQPVADASTVLNPTQSSGDRFQKVYEPRRSKRLHKSTKCGTGGHKVAKHH